MKKTVTSKILTGLLAILMVFAMIPVTTEAVFADNEDVPLLTIVMVPGDGTGDPITVTSRDKDYLTTDDAQNKTGLFWIDYFDPTTVNYQCTGKPDSFTGPSGASFLGWAEGNSSVPAFGERGVLSGKNGKEFTLTAIWSHEVSFNSKCDSDIPTQTVMRGGKAIEPEKPVREGWEFAYWYAGSEINTAYKFNDAVTSNIQLTALWHTKMLASVLDRSNPGQDPLSYDCGTFDVNTSVSAYDKEDKNYIEVFLPEGPVTFTAKPEEGYHFVGWYEGYNTISDTPLTTNPEFTTNAGGDIVKVTAAFEPTTSTTTKKDNEIEPTCTQPGGYDEVEYCTICGKELSRTHVEIPATDHVWDSVYTVDKKATFSAAGTKSYHCSVCNAVNTDSTVAIPKLTAKLSATEYTHDGNVKAPVVTVKSGTKTLKKNADYTPTYASGRKNVGTYTVTVKMKGEEYSGSTTLSFKINPKGASIKTPVKGKQAVTVKWKAQTAKMSKSRITGYQILLATDSKFTKNKRTVNVKGYKTVSKKVTKLKGKKKYYIKIRTYKTVSGTKYYSGWSKVKTVNTL